MGDSEKKSGARITLIVALIGATAIIVAALIGPQIIINVNEQGQETAFAQIQPTINSLQNPSTQTPYIVEVTRLVPGTQLLEVTQPVEAAVTVPPSDVVVITSFDSKSTNGWTLERGTLSNPGIGGNTGNENDGHLRFEDRPSDGVGYYIAPPIFYGDWRKYSTLQIDTWSSLGTYFISGYGMKGDIYLANGPLEAWRFLPYRPSESWETFIIPLVDDGQWFFGVGTMRLDDVLANVTNFRIRAEYGKGEEDFSGLDNVVLK